MPDCSVDLPLQGPHLAVHFRNNVSQTKHILFGRLELAHGNTFSGLIFDNPRRLFKEVTAVFRLGT
ncbi:MAG: hypothetical protein BWY07_01960 [Candidatus Hydrogenedentes bacterium ADurb.Bin170]|nr:MAG: hypothetical protein BWY07_01960 [Candidatus Hydrogenedentes bacterium ADurb.Bin170]